jgi:hypothetical protein
MLFKEGLSNNNMNGGPRPVRKLEATNTDPAIANLLSTIPPNLAKLPNPPPKPFVDPMFHSKSWEGTATLNFHGVDVRLKFVRTHYQNGSKRIYVYLLDDPNQRAACNITLNAFGGIKGSKVNFISGTVGGMISMAKPMRDRENIYHYMLSNLREKSIDKGNPDFAYLAGLSENARLLGMRSKLPGAPAEAAGGFENALNVDVSRSRASPKPLKTAGLNTCTAVAFSHGAVNFLAHVTASDDPRSLQDSISRAFNVEELKKDTKFKIYLFFGDSETQGSYLVIMKALRGLGLVNNVRVSNELTTLLDTVAIDKGVPYLHKHFP